MTLSAAVKDVESPETGTGPLKHETRIRLLTVVGARPQFIKAAAVSRAIAEHNRARPDAAVLEKILHTGQHYDERMSEVFFDELNIPQPDMNLGVGSGTHGSQTGQMLEKIERVLEEEEPDWCLVYGDTNSTLAGALAAAKLHIPIAHVESGVRSYNRRMPEEVNRLVTDTLSSLLLCPTETAVRNLAKEGITSGVHNTGDVMYDSVLYYSKKAESVHATLLARLGIRPRCFHLATVHRAENTDDGKRLHNIMRALGDIGEPECPVILSLHPRTEKMLKAFGIDAGAPAVRRIRPVSYLEMISLEQNAKVILTDSGGIQREAFFLGTPCLVLRDETEWDETVDIGASRLCDSDPDKIASAMLEVSEANSRTGPFMEETWFPTTWLRTGGLDEAPDEAPDKVWERAEEVRDKVRDEVGMEFQVSEGGTASSADLFGNGRAAEKILRLLLGETRSS